MYQLIRDLEELREALGPAREGAVPFVGFDTETSEVHDERFTPWGTDTRIAGYSFSYDLPSGPRDYYVPIRHRPYDWRRRVDLLEAVEDGAWVRRLRDDEGVTLEGTWLEGWDPNLPPQEALCALEEAMSRPGVEWGAHDWRFDASMLLADDVEPPWERLFCTKIASVFTDPRPLDRFDEEAKAFFHTGHGLKPLGEAWLGLPPEEKDLLDRAREVLQCNDFGMLPLRTILAPYAAKDTRLVVELARHEKQRAAYKDPHIRALIEKHAREMRLAVEMERRGVRVDREAALAAAKEAEGTIGGLFQRVNALAGQQLPLNSPKELADALYGRLALPTYRGIRNTRKPTLKQVRQRLLKVPGTYLAGEGALESEKAVELIDAIIDYRRASKELTGFYRPLTYFGEEGRIHTCLRPLQAKTTRYSASKPNVQQMPRKGNVRKLFIPSPGHVFILLDYGQQELRVGAHYAQVIPRAFEWRFTWPCTLAKRGDCKGRPPHGPADDQGACRKVVHVGWRNNWNRAPLRMGLVEGFLSGDVAFDPHQSMMDTCQERGHSHIDRTIAKSANFALLYGAGPKKLAETLDVTLDFAKELHSIFWNHAYPELGRVKNFIDERLRRVGPGLPWSHQEFIRTLHGGRIYLDEGYYGLNYIIQRSCREILLNAILDTAEYFQTEGIPYRQIFPVHDELVLEAPEDEVDRVVVRRISQIMVEAGRACTIPMVVEPKIARTSWGEKEALPEGWGFNGVLER